jgi:hypothetical protein
LADDDERDISAMQFPGEGDTCYSAANDDAFGFFHGDYS